MGRASEKEVARSEEVTLGLPYNEKSFAISGPLVNGQDLADDVKMKVSSSNEILKVARYNGVKSRSQATHTLTRPQGGLARKVSLPPSVRMQKEKTKDIPKIPIQGLASKLDSPKPGLEKLTDEATPSNRNK